MENEIFVARFACFNVEKNEKKTILRDVENAFFPNLKVIGLWENKIESLENLSRIWMP